ncbi:MAG: KEOPS complex subunit [Thermococci archaeon]|nr:KEOPS complex subunit [Thermococci archaeon]
MKVNARVEIRIEYGSGIVAESVAKAVDVDNTGMPRSLRKSLNVETTWVDGELITKVKYSGEIETLIKALDDLVFSIKVAEEMAAGT